MNESTKRKLLIGVAIFCLLVFSVSPAVTTFFTHLFVSDQLGSIELPDGRIVGITLEDNDYGIRLSRLDEQCRLTMQGAPGSPAPFALLSASTTGDEAKRERVDAYKVLRRVAVEAGIDVAEQDIVAAREYGRKVVMQIEPSLKAEDYTPMFFARSLGVTNLTDLDNILREALRITAYIQLELEGGLDVGDAALADVVAKERKLAKLSYMRFPTKEKIEEAKLGPPSDAELLTWVEGLEDDSLKTGLVDPLHVRWGMVWADYDKLDPARFEAYTKDMVVGDADIEAYYDRNKDTYFRKPKAGGGEKGGEKQDGEKQGGEKPGGEKQDGEKPGGNDKGGEDENGGLTVQDGAGQAEQGGDQKPSGDQSSTGDQPSTGDQKPADTGAAQPTGQTPPPPDSAAGLPIPPEQVEYFPLDEVKERIRRRLEVRNVLEGLRKKAFEAKAAHDATRSGKQDEGKDGKKEENEDEGGNKDGDKGEGQGKEGDGNAKDGEKDQGDMGPSLPPFNLETWLRQEFGGEALPEGLEWVDMGPLGTPESFREHDPYGTWEGTWVLGIGEGDLPTEVQETDKGAFFFQLLERKQNVVKPIDDIRKDAIDVWAKKTVADSVKKLAGDIREEIRKQAEALKPEEVAKLREDSATKAAADLEAWREGLQSRVTKAEEEISTGALPERAVARRKQDIETWRKELETEADRKKAIDEAAEKQLEADITELVKPVLAEAFGKVATDTGRTPVGLGPWPLDEDEGERFQLLEEGPEKYLKALGDVKDAEKGWVSDVLEDAADGSYYVVRMDDVEAGGLDAVTRKAMAKRRGSFTVERFDSVLNNAYEPKALLERFKLKNRQTGQQ
ncbi:MAG: hypothetical protein R3F30_12810 [Planctomycetota bacterium]